MTLNKESGPIPWVIIAIFSLTALLIALGGGVYYFSEQQRVRTEKQKELSVIAELKADQISRWRQERLDDGQVLFKNSLMSHRIKEFQGNPRSFSIKQEVLSWMASLLNNQNYSNVFLLNPEGRILLAGGSEEENLGLEVRSLIADIGRVRNVVISNLVEAEYNRSIHMDILIPIVDPEESQPPLVGFLILRIDPYQILYPLLQSWPVPSRTSETLLLRQEGKEFLCLNDLRLQRNTAFVLRLPLQTFTKPQKAAVPFAEGVFEFNDYRGAPVLSSLHRIPNSPWFLLSKIDAWEIFEPMTEKAWMIIVLVCLTIVVAGTSLGYYWRNQRAGFYRRRYEIELEREEKEKALREKEMRYRLLFEIAQEAILIIKGEVIRDCNPAAELLLAVGREEILGKNFFYFAPERQSDGRLSKEKGAEIVGRAIHQGPQWYEWLHRTPEGKTVEVEVSLSLFYLEGESHLLVMERDITDRKQAEEEVQKLATVVRRSSDLINLATPDGKMIFLNEAGSHMLGIDPEQVQQVYILEVIPDHLHDLVQHELLPTLMRQETWEGELQYRNLKSGEIVEVHAITFTISDPVSGALLYLANISRDLTDRKRAEEERRLLEERLQRAEKMEALGTLAGGVAHDMNNVLGVLVGYSELLMLEAEAGSPFLDHAGNILKAGQRASAIIQDLLTLTRRGVENSVPLDMNRIISDFLKTPEFEQIKAFHRQVIFRQELDPDLLPLEGSPVQLSKMIMNLLLNAAEAISDRGEVVIRTQNRYIDQSLPGYEETTEGEYVLLKVSDTGIGIPSTDLKRIFEPFYTKKKMGRSGTGLGLAVVWGTVKDHKGYIDVKSEEGNGSTFFIYFPITRKALEEEGAGPAQATYAGQGESILVVDDIQEQRMLADRMLTSLGYRVETAERGEEAIEYLETHQADLLVLDMIMDPGIDGLETYKRILEIHPRQKAIIVSGFSESVRVRQAQLIGAGAYVRKPYLRETLGRAVRLELDRKD